MTNSPDWQQTIVPERTAFFLDVDGTLLGFKDRPEEVAADADLRDLLGRLVDASDGAVALVSGRMVADLDRIMAPLVLPAGGVHGADLRFADGHRQAFAGGELAEVRAKAERLVRDNEGLRFEDKGGSTFAVHFRAVPERGETVIAVLQEAVAGRELMVQPGKMVAEVKPKGCHKGIAIETLMATEPFAGRVPLFIGDDLTDEYGFQAANAADGVSIKVGGADEATVAHYRLADVNAVRDFLRVICRSDRGVR